MKGYIIKNMQLATGSMLTTHTTTAARTMTTCATNKNTKNRRIKFNMKTKKIETTLSWKPERNMLSRNLVIKALLLLMLTGLATAKGTENSFNTHKMSTMTNKLKEQYSQPLYSTASSENNADDVFRPMIPKDMKSDYISRNMFTKTGQYRVFQPVESDLRRATAIDNSNQRRQLLHHQRMWEAENLQADSSIQHGIDNEISEFTEFGKAAIFDEPTNKAMFVVDKHMLPLALPTERTTTTTETSTLPPLFSTIITTPTPETTLKEILTTELKSLDDLLVEYMENFYNNGAFEPLPELVIELQNNHTATTTISPSGGADENNLMRRVRGIARDSATSPSSLDTVTDKIHFNLPRALQTGRLLFFTGLKKILWPVFVGLQILKSLLLAMFLPSLIGSFGKLVGKGIASASIRPMEAPQELDFRDNSFNFDEENNKFIINDDGGGKDGAAYAYNQPEASQTHYSHTTYDAANINNQALSRYGVNEKQLNKMPDSYMSVLQSLGAASFKNSGSFSSGSSQPGGGGGGAAALVSPAMRPKPMAAANLNNFQTFQKVPASSLLLSNYDPFYSPLLSRLDSVFAQLKLNSANEVCREKLICLMYANPAKYAPYSNLVSAQLSRELNELRKPTSDNPDILRFFKYMRAAKDGQDGIDCEESFDGCKEFKDFENPAMVSTYHDINKLVQARKMN